MAKYVFLKDKNLKPENIKAGVKILKVTGSYGGGEGEWDWVVQAKRHEIDDVSNHSIEELAQLEWGACGILSGTEITELPEIDFSDPIATHGLAYAFAGTGISDVEIPATTNALNAHSCFEGMFFECNDLEYVTFTDFAVTPYTDGEMSEHFERAFMNAGGNVSPVIEWVDPEDHTQGGEMSPGLLIEFPNLTYANSTMFNDAFRGIKGADASFGILGVAFPVLEKIGGTYTPSNNAKALPSNNGVKCFYNAFHSSRLYNESEGNPTSEWNMQYGTMQNIFPALTEIHGNAVFAHAFSRSNLYEFSFLNELTLYLGGDSETEGMFECVCRDCKGLQSISLSAKYYATEGLSTKVWRDAFSGCDNLLDAYISDTLVAYPDSRNILESAVNVDYIELHTLPDFDWESGDPYPGHDMYFTWQPNLSFDSIMNILDFAWNEFGDAEDEPHEIWFYENTIIEDNPDYNPEDPEIMQMVDEIMEYKANLESCGWTIHNLYRSASDVPGDGYIDCDYIALSIDEEEPLLSILDAKRDGETKAGDGKSGAKSPADPEAENYCLVDNGLNENFMPDHIDWLFTCPDSEITSYFVFGAMETYMADDTRMWGVFNDSGDIYICLGTELQNSLCILSSDIDLSKGVHIVGDLVEVQNGGAKSLPKEWHLTVNGEQYTTDPGDWFDFPSMGILGGYNTTSDKVVFGLPSDVKDIKIGHLRFSADDGDMWLNYEPCSGIHKDDFGDITRADAFIKGTCGMDDIQFYGFTLAEGASAEPRDFSIDFDSTYEVQGGVEMLPIFDSSGIPAFVEGSGGGGDWLTEALAGNITDLSGYELPAPNHDKQYYNLFWKYPVEGMPDFSGWTSASGNNAMDYAFYDSSISGDVDMSNLTSISGNYIFSNAFYNCSGITSVNLSSLASVTGTYPCMAMFSNCGNLQEVHLDSFPSAYNNNQFMDMFYMCPNLETVYCSGATLEGNNPINFSTVENLYITIAPSGTNNLNLTGMSGLTPASVLNVLQHLTNQAGYRRSISFYTNGLTVQDDAQGSIQAAYDAARAKNWTIANLTITPDPGL